MVRLAVLALASLLLLGTPAWGQSAEEIEELIRQLGSEGAKVSNRAARTLSTIGPPAVPALTAALADEDLWVRRQAALALGRVGTRASPAILALIGALSDESDYVRQMAAIALRRIGPDEALWWVVPRVFWKELVGLLLLLAAWFALAARFPRHRPTSTPKHLALMALTAAVPAGLSCSAVRHAITRDWAQGFLPDTLTLVPFPVAAVLSTALVCALPAVWVCQRKPEASADVGVAGQ